MQRWCSFWSLRISREHALRLLSIKAGAHSLVTALEKGCLQSLACSLQCQQMTTSLTEQQQTTSWGPRTWEDAGEWKQTAALVSRQCWSHWDSRIQKSLPDCCQKFKHNKGLSKSAGVRVTASKEHLPACTLSLLSLVLDSAGNTVWLDASVFPKSVSSSENGAHSLAGLFWVLSKVIHREALLHSCAMNKCSKNLSRSKYNRRPTRLHLALNVRRGRSAETRVTAPRPHPEEARAIL